MRRAIPAVLFLCLGTLLGCDAAKQKSPAPADAADRAAQSTPVEANPGGETAASDDRDTKPAGNAGAPQEPKVRKFTFAYQFRVKGLQASGDTEKNLVRAWLPCPSDNDHQQITRLDTTGPSEITETKEPRFSNRLLYFETTIPTSGEFSVSIPYEVVRHEVLRGESQLADRKVEPLGDDEREKLLAADSMVPTTGKPLALLAAVKLPKEKLALARQLYNVVDDHVAYKKEGTGWGRGDTNWVCDSGYGNCTDFHSLFMSLARSQDLPARFEMGFSIPTDKTEGPIAGYHCWAWFYLDGRGWIPVDISEADKFPAMKPYYFGNLTADRVMFSTGRDLELVPKSEHSPLNFLIYPHIEVGGKVLPKENVELQFAFKDKQ